MFYHVFNKICAVSYVVEVHVSHTTLFPLSDDTSRILALSNTHPNLASRMKRPWTNQPNATPLSLAPPSQRGRWSSSISLGQASHFFTTTRVLPIAGVDGPRRVAVRGMAYTALH